LLSITKFVVDHSLVRMTDNIAQALEVEEVAASTAAAAAVFNDVYF